MRSNRWEALQSLLLSLSLLFSFLSLTFSYPSLFYFHPTSVMIPSDKWYHLLGNREKTIFLVMMSSVIPGVLIRARIAGRRRRMKIAPKIFCVTVSTEFDYYLLILLIIFSLSLSLLSLACVLLRFHYRKHPACRLWLRVVLIRRRL